MILETSNNINICCGEKVTSTIWTQAEGNYSVLMGICPKCKSLFINQIKNMIDQTTLPDTSEIKQEVKDETKLDNISQSPLSAETKIISTMSLPDALKEVIVGKKITRLEWNDKKYYGVLEEGFLVLHKPGGKIYQWIISDGDLIGEDYIVIK